jgi:hypothetical protein
MKVRSPEQSAERYVQHTLRSVPDWIRESMRAYLDPNSNQSFEWITGMIRAFGDNVVAARILRELGGEGRPERYERLALWVHSELGTASN